MRINFYREFVETTSKCADKIAVIDGDKSISFGDLKSLESAYACSILDITQHSENSKVIGVFLPKGIEAVAANIAIMHTCNIYMNLDVKYPSERLKNIFSITKPVCIITSLEFSEILSSIAPHIPLCIVENSSIKEANLKALENKLLRAIDTDALCIINTSGSTGTPKAVVLSHRNFFDFIECSVQKWGLENDEIIGSLSPIIFDIFSYELALLITKSATIACISEKIVMFPVRILEFLENHNVTFIFWVPTIMVNIANLNILDNFTLKSLKHIWFAGEVFPTKQFNIWYKKLENSSFVNLYGPIEITLDCAWYEVDRDFDDDEALPIGKECENKNVMILNENDELVAPGECGEICVRGSGVALGYYNDPAKTALAFVQNPLNHAYNEIIYRTGDIGQYNERGEIMFKGRKDSIIKHYGYRIELGEIEHIVINKLKLFTNACVVYNWDKKEITLIYESQTDMGIAQIKKAMMKDLPKYMIPTAFVRKDALPMGATGKVDRAKLNKEING